MLHERVEQVFQQVFNDPDLSLDDHTTAADIEGWDSFQHVLLLFQIEQEFGVQFAGEEASSLRDIGQLKTLLRDKGID